MAVANSEHVTSLGFSPPDVRSYSIPFNEGNDRLIGNNHLSFRCALDLFSAHNSTPCLLSLLDCSVSYFMASINFRMIGPVRTRDDIRIRWKMATRGALTSFRSRDMKTIPVKAPGDVLRYAVGGFMRFIFA